MTKCLLLKHINIMKSKLKFALDGNNKAIIDAYIEHSDDLRDEVALQFKQNFKSSGNLAVMQFCFGGNTQISITPYGGDFEESKKIANTLSLFQLDNLALALEKERADRLKTGEYQESTTYVNNTKISIQGSSKGDLIVDKSYDKINSARKVNIGHKLDEIRIGATIKSISDIEYMIELLNNSIPCFEK